MVTTRSARNNSKQIQSSNLAEKARTYIGVPPFLRPRPSEKPRKVRVKQRKMITEKPKKQHIIMKQYMLRSVKKKRNNRRNERTKQEADRKTKTEMWCPNLADNEKFFVLHDRSDGVSFWSNVPRPQITQHAFQLQGLRGVHSQQLGVGFRGENKAGVKRSRGRRHVVRVDGFTRNLRRIDSIERTDYNSFKYMFSTAYVNFEYVGLTIHVVALEDGYRPTKWGPQLLRGTTDNRTCGIHKNLHT